jgi:hypothetical protein
MSAHFEDQDLSERLRGAYPDPTPLELDRAKQLAMKRARARGRLGLAGLRARIAFATLVAAGALMIGSGATMAVVGSSDGGSAAVQQYGPEKDTEASIQKLRQRVQRLEQENQKKDTGRLPWTGFTIASLLVLAGGALIAGQILRSRVKQAE